ncbi:unnamed protein product [Somion occarium]|uniref:Uncharacterized protein n=1 Tax=Somion occarium TaxID=3059160 RepID=A0ABP1DH95_9APHY
MFIPCPPLLLVLVLVLVGGAGNVYKACPSYPSSSLSSRFPPSSQSYNFHLSYLLIIMSDTGRQSWTDKASAAVKPDSQKTTTEHIGDKFKGNADSAASSAEPQSQKSTGQGITDAFSGNSNETQPSVTQKVKNSLGLGETQ